MAEAISDRCPTCGGQSIFVGKGGLLTCSYIECEVPGVSRGFARKAHGEVMDEQERCIDIFATCLAMLHPDAREKVMRAAIREAPEPKEEK